MKKTLIYLMLFHGVLASAQLRDDNLHAIDITAGYAENGFGACLSYNRFISQSRKNNYFQLSVLYTISDIEKDHYKLPYNLMTASLGYFYNFPIDRYDKYNFNVGGGIVSGYEKINDGNKELDTGAILVSQGGFIYGPFVGAEFEMSISHKVYLIIKANEYYHINSDIGKFTMYAGGGIKIFL